MSMNRLFKCKIGKELVVTLVTLALMWLGYYADNNLFGDNILFALGSMLLVVIGLCIVFPLFWVTKITKEGIKGLGITKKRLGLALLFSVVLGIWRFLEIREFLGSPALVPTILFNALSIWEVMFIFGWLFTRYDRAFGKVPAIVLTAVSVGVYHIGTLSFLRIGVLCLTVAICGIFYAISENIFTLWPIYWAIGCSASTLKSGMNFPDEMILLSAITLAIQILIIFCFHRWYQRTVAERSVHVADS